MICLSVEFFNLKFSLKNFIIWFWEASWTCGMVSDTNLGKLNYHYFSCISSVLFFALLRIFPFLLCSAVVPQSFDLLFFSLCSLCLSVFNDSTAVCSSSEILSSAMSSLLIAPQRCSSFYYTGFISSTSFWFFLSIPICLHCPSVLTCWLHFPLEPLVYNLNCFKFPVW